MYIHNPLRIEIIHYIKCGEPPTLFGDAWSLSLLIALDEVLVTQLPLVTASTHWLHHHHVYNVTQCGSMSMDPNRLYILPL